MENINYKLYKAIQDHFDLGELRTLCFFLGVDIDNLGGETLGDKIIELISLSQRTVQTEKLVKFLQQERPQTNWHEIAGISSETRDFSSQLPPDIDKVLDFAKKVAKDGGRIARQYYEDKENKIYSPETIKNLTTEADKAANEEIIHGIKESYPGHHIISEEGGMIEGKPKERGYTWVIDAIDGTVNFYHQTPIFCTAVGVLWNRVPVAGVIYNPITRELFFASKGRGAYIKGVLHGRPIDTSLYTNEESKLSKSVVMTHLSSRRYARERFTTSGLLDALSNASRSIRVLGSGQMSLAYIAQARFHAFVNNSTHSWDQVAGLVLVEEAGGIITGFRGEQWSIDSESIIATANQELHNQLVAIISAIYPFEGPVHRLGVLLRQRPELEARLVDFIESLDS